MDNPRTKLITGGIIVTIIVVAVFLFLFAPFQSVSVLKVFYMRQTNSVEGNLMAVFVVTNKSDSKIEIISYGMEILKNGTWKKLDDSQNRISIIAGHKSEDLIASISTNLEPQRIQVRWFYKEALPIEHFRDSLVMNFKHNLNRLIDGKKLELQTGNFREFNKTFAQIITNPPSPSASHP